MESRRNGLGRRPPPPSLDFNNPKPLTRQYEIQMQFPLQEQIQAVLEKHHCAIPSPDAGPYLGRRPPGFDFNKPLPRKKCYRAQMQFPMQQTLQIIFNAESHVLSLSDLRNKPPIWDPYNTNQAAVNNWARGIHPIRDDIAKGTKSACAFATTGPFGPPRPRPWAVDPLPLKTSGHLISYPFINQFPFMGFCYWKDDLTHEDEAKNTETKTFVFMMRLRLLKNHVAGRFRSISLATSRKIKHKAERIVERIMDLTNGNENPHQLIEPFGKLRTDCLDDTCRAPETVIVIR